ncbi:MAG: ABC transporter substrate-binding protein [Moraxellaceae bacterium]|nr:ABC transporter substrate-binding protein [Moraxellaceae bacterium]
MLRKPHVLMLGASLALASAFAHAYQEAPVLAQKVKAKELPPVAERLPEKPEVVKPIERVGTYGGSLRSALRGNNDYHAILRLVGNQGLVRWTMDFNGTVPNLAESWTVSADASEYTFKLRKGTKWSDGTPFTAEDVLFAMNDIVGNTQFLGTPPENFVVGNKLVTTTKVDDYTVRMKFAGPYAALLDTLAHPLGQYPVMYQKKYCSQFHPKYNPKIAEQLTAASVKDWPTLFRVKCGDIEVPTRWGNPEKPTLDPWVIQQPYGGAATQVVLQRNPYFWQVDTAGNQLPYIDTLNMPIINEVESMVLAAIGGRLDFQHRHIFPIQNRPVLAENAVKGRYTVMSLSSLNANSVGMYINLSTPNPKLRKLVLQKDFRIALSHGIDRKEVADIVYLGQAQPWQTGPVPESKWYIEKMGKQYLELDVAKANAMLDKMGLTTRDKDGYRQYPDGGRIAINTIVAIQLQQQLEAMELVRKQWSKIGIELVIRAGERSLTFERANNNDYDMSVDVAPGGLDATQNPRSFLTMHPESRQSVLWYRWYASNGKQGEEPTASMKQRIQLYEDWRAAKSSAEADKIFKQILEISANEFEVIGVVRPPRDNAIRKTDLKNVYDKMPAGWSWPTPGPSLLQTWFYAK